MNGQTSYPAPSQTAQISEQVTKSLALQLAQAMIDKAFLEARLSLLVEHVRIVLTTTQWVQDDDGVMSPVVAAEPLQALQSLVLNPL